MSDFLCTSPEKSRFDGSRSYFRKATDGRLPLVQEGQVERVPPAASVDRRRWPALVSREVLVPEYRLFFIEPTPKHIRQIVDFDAVDDVDAVRCATARSADRAWELWRNECLVGAFTKHAQPIPVSPRPRSVLRSH
jgi:hypothetical protein